MFDVTEIVKAFLVLLAAVVTYIVVPYIKSRTTAEQQQTINGWIRIAVAAAEQIYNGEGRGAEKKQYVLGFLSDKGFKLDETSLDAMIEAAVLQLNSGLV